MRKDIFRAVRPGAALCVALVICVACAGHSDYRLPTPGNDAPFSASGEAFTRDKWWQSLGSPALDAHIEAALGGNFTLGAAWQRLQAARAIARGERSELFPELDLTGDAAREIDGRPDDRFSAGPVASYEVDLWGRIRAGADAEALRAEASLQQYRTAAITLSADTAITWVRLVEARRQLALLDRQREINRQALEVLRARFGAGQVRSEDILRQQLLLQAVEEDIISIESAVATLQNQLAVLRGEAPQAARFDADGPLPALAPGPDAGLPADLVTRRPDIRAAWLSLQAADRDLAAAVRDQYPSLTLSASYLSDATTPSGLFSNWIASLAGGLVAPVFDAGQRRAEIRRREAERDEMVKLYARQVLEAFREVEDALVLEKQQRRRLENLEARLGLARDTFEQIRLGYLNGANEFISVLTAQVELQTLERSFLQARRELIEFRIALHRALAGGFDTPREAAIKRDGAS